MLKFAREEFERHRHVTDADHIKYLLSVSQALVAYELMRLIWILEWKDPI